METTREQVLRLVRGHREITTAQIAEALGVSQAAVRRHLDGLRADGLIDARLDRHGVGRPSLVFFPTERGEESSGRRYLQLLTRLFRRLDRMDETAVGGRSGREVLEEALSEVAFEVAAAHEAEVVGTTLAERVQRASRALKEEGIVDGWRPDGDSGFRLVNGECPYIRIAEITDAPCRSDRQSIELLIGAHVDQIRRIAEGSPVCEYIVREPRPAEGAAGA
ncbi:MAG TPA: ArsR family transcriptional regulator [Dehalococcoidia bacterium]|nr:ArsR family transcriptional regulator [Dehalococcoidia bacterium]